MGIGLNKIFSLDDKPFEDEFLQPLNALFTKKYDKIIAFYKELIDVPKVDNLENLSVLTAGLIPPDPIRLLNSQRMKDIVREKFLNRFKTLEIKFKDKNISDVLEMTVNEAEDFFKAVPSIREKMSTLKRVGLGYIKVGQQATTLSGGEAQRVKLAKELARRSSGSTLYILDEPTTGLHFHDIKKLLEILHELVEKGNTVIVIEHNLDVIKTADYVIDIGPEGGDKGGEVVCHGTPEYIATVKESFTGAFLSPIV